MTKRMLIDATHDEETRVAVVDGNRLEEFDYESIYRKALKGNIYLAKVTRVEPSLQAAFVNFGGNRHGFLPFSEIHPDYFRIPVADREAFLAAQEEEIRAHDEKSKNDDEEVDEDEENAIDTDEDGEEIEEVVDLSDEIVPLDADDEDEDSDEKASEGKKNKDSSDDEQPEDASENEENSNDDDNRGNRRHNNRGRGRGRGGRGRGRDGRGRGKNMPYRSRKAEIVAGDDFADESKFRFNMRHKYKIQEVIKRGQIMLVQVSREERGNKGAAVSSYLSLPGRYCVLMPNSPRAGGVSRKIANYKDRNRMRDILKEMDIPQGMSVIVRTAGVARTKTEIKRDLEYLLRLWDKIRELTLESSAPALVYEEANLIKRSIRDIYTRDVEDVIVAGDEGYKNTKDFMKMMIPSHAKRVKQYTDQKPLFVAHKVEDQITEIGEPTARLKSGGYLVINPTEALVSIDVNSGRATKERHIEETALKTNMEAAEEVARQLRLRDLGGLVVIDFIDMEDRRNNIKVEKKLRECLSNDRARIQVGRISSFGLLELSRQRLNPSLTEAQYEVCSSCKGTGTTRTADATSISLLRALEGEGLDKQGSTLNVFVCNGVALYLLNNKRKHLNEIEEHYGLTIQIKVDDEISPSLYRIETVRTSQNDDDDDDRDQNNSSANRNTRNNNQDDDDNDRRGNSRRRGRRGGRNRSNNQSNSDNSNDQDQDSEDQNNNNGQEGSDEKKSHKKPASHKKSSKPDDNTDQAKSDPKPEDSKDKADPKNDDAKDDKKKSSRSRKSDDEKTAKKSPEKKPAPSNDSKPEKKEKKPDNSYAKNFETVNEAPKKKKKGWWSL